MRFATIAEVLADAGRGRMCILIDDEDRENEGDLVVAAQFATPDVINFMAKHGRGLICLPLEPRQVQRLGLPPMTRRNASRHETAFTVSIEAREGITTGISAADRAHTIQTAINPDCTPDAIVSPGHVFPLQAREGGVLVRAGHTEAAVDIARLAGCIPAGVICEIMKDNGEMARLPDLAAFAETHRLPIATIADLIAYRRQTEKLVTRTHSTAFESRYGGTFTLHVYTTTLEYAEHIALVKGDVQAQAAPLVRMHALDVLSDVLGDRANPRSGDLTHAMETIARAGSGVLVLLRAPRRDAVSARVAADDDNGRDLREYGIGDLGIQRMRLLTNHPKQVVGLEGYGLEIAGFAPIA